PDAGIGADSPERSPGIVGKAAGVGIGVLGESDAISGKPDGTALRGTAGDFAIGAGSHVRHPGLAGLDPDLVAQRPDFPFFIHDPDGALRPGSNAANFAAFSWLER